jgi:flagellar biosynthesis protein FlhF
MQLRTFLAKNMHEALSLVRAEMGEEAVIVGSQRTRDGGIMIRAAADEAFVAQVEEVASPEVEERDELPPSFESEHRAALIRRLRGEPAKSTLTSRSFNRPELLRLLLGHRAPDGIAHDLAKTAEQSGLSDMTLALACALDRRMKIEPIDVAKNAAFLLVGPHGAGKTAVAAKLAAHARLTHRAVKLVATDTAGAGAVARLQTFAGHLEAPFVVAENVDALAKITAECTSESFLAVIDTAGFDPRNGKARAAFSALGKIEGVEALGVISAAIDAEETSEIVGALASLGARRLIVTGLDIARRLGALVAAATGPLRLAQVTRSPFIAAGLETLTPLSLARALIESGARDANQASAQ